ncbi:helix-turn-helix domain-containing protein [Chryseobacterium sp. RU33C]|uniref:helix-turn-helix domain-containing protein n=1 Tax=Chryseobacterium sp. RU33C TaxID=1907398 RepID=UPI0009572250|nr:helix-turn-helix domain-containing protein [Chryseobacterium sp. RU33C]SIR73017.1 Helix-turn-helix domain-containing protein [Chryseobacterium sp. RU33C]
MNKNIENSNVITALTQFLAAFSSVNTSDEKMNVILSKIESIEKVSSNTEEEYLLTNEVCKITRKSRPTIIDWRKKGILKPFGKSGRNYLYKKSDVLNFISNSGKFCNA